jgi:succinylglutamate desuccinylase
LKVDHREGFPERLLSIEPSEIRSVFPNPTLISIAGAHAEPLFLSTCLHGNETTSFYVLQNLARRYASVPPPRNLLIFVGNVEAMAADLRFMPDQPDFNRIWAGGEGPFHDLVHEVVEIARAQEPFASIDIHNNSGKNPHYGCVNALRPVDLNLAALFAKVGVFYQNPNTTQSIAFSRFCPAVTIEAGKSGDLDGVVHVTDFVEKVLWLEHLPDHAPPADALRLYETIGSVVIDPGQSFGFGPGAVDLQLRADLESMNFTQLEAGALWATQAGKGRAMKVIDEHGDDLTDRFFVFEGQEVRLARAITPAMITQDQVVIRQDCLCYLMVEI